MAASAFAFYRGAAAVMAADIATTPVSGLRVQAIGDAHISNFGVFASPDRRLVFDANDFDETLPAPWEWDVKRLVASAAVATLEYGRDARAAAAAAARAAAVYRASMAQLRRGGQPRRVVRARRRRGPRRPAHRQEEPRRRSSSSSRRSARAPGARVIGKMTEVVDGQLRFKSQPPLITPLRELVAADETDETRATVTKGYEAYRASLAPELRALLDRFRMVDMARKVVGVGSVGTRCFIGLFLGRDEDDALVLQFKQAVASVLEPYAGRSAYRHHGARVVHGQRAVQLNGDIFLGWSTLKDVDQHYYWRQLKDMKASAEIGLLGPKQFTRYVDICAWCLANAHARSGDPVAIAAYLGKSAAFDKAMAEFAVAYAGQTKADWQALKAAIDAGKITAQAGV